MPGTTAARPERALWPFLAYLVGFHLVWACWPVFVYPKVVAIGEATLTYALVSIAVRLVVWVLPVWLYLRVVDDVDPARYLKLREHRGRGLVVAIVTTALNLAGSVARFGAPHLDPRRLTWHVVLGTSILVGFIEEIPYRGFILQKLAERTRFWIATLVSSTLFVMIHVPGWLALGQLHAGTVATIFVFGVVMAAIFKWSDSLWAPIVAHSANDFLSFVLFHR